MTRSGTIRDSGVLTCAIALLAFLLANAATSFGCTCGTPKPSACSQLAAEASAIFVGTVDAAENPPEAGNDRGLSKYRFHVDEHFAGSDEEFVDVYSGRGATDCSFWFTEGRTYLVFAYKETDGKLHTTECSPTAAVEDATALLSQLRSRRDGKPVANLFGVIRWWQQPFESVKDEDYDAPVPGTIVQLSDGARRFDAKTDDNGAYYFYSLPGGTYQISANLPLGFMLAVSGDRPVDPITLPEKACFQTNLNATSTAAIRGRVFTPDGGAIKGGRVSISRADRYSENEDWSVELDAGGAYSFEHLVDGDYIIVFNSRNLKLSAAPYPRTFYPAAGEIADAMPLHVGEGQQLRADIHTSSSFATRELAVNVLNDPKKDGSDLSVRARASKDEDVNLAPDGPRRFRGKLLVGVSYLVSAAADCGGLQVGNRNTPIVAQTPSVQVDVSDSAPAEIDVSFAQDACEAARQKEMHRSPDKATTP
jgi:hypothetical protein